MKRILVLSLAMLFLATAVSAGNFAGRSIYPLRSAPRLIEPRSEVVDLKGRDSLRFYWSREGDSTKRKYYDFRLYKGYQTVEDTLLYQENISQNEVWLDQAIFDDGQVYTWSVRQVDRRQYRGRRNFASFRIVK